MHIRQSISIEASPDIAMEAARNWMREELREMGGEIVEGLATDGVPSISSSIDQDGIRMSTSVVVRQQAAGTSVTMILRTQGLSRSAKIRNLSLLPGRAVVQRQVKASLEEIRSGTRQ